MTVFTLREYFFCCVTTLLLVGILLPRQHKLIALGNQGLGEAVLCHYDTQKARATLGNSSDLQPTS